MGDCKMCHRPLERKRGAGAANVECEPQFCCDPGSLACEAAAVAYRRGLRGGLTIARALAKPTLDYDSTSSARIRIDWSEAEKTIEAQR